MGATELDPPDHAAHPRRPRWPVARHLGRQYRPL